MNLEDLRPGDRVVVQYRQDGKLRAEDPATVTKAGPTRVEFAGDDGKIIANCHKDHWRFAGRVITVRPLMLVDLPRLAGRIDGEDPEAALDWLRLVAGSVEWVDEDVAEHLEGSYRHVGSACRCLTGRPLPHGGHCCLTHDADLTVWGKDDVLDLPACHPEEWAELRNTNTKENR